MTEEQAVLARKCVRCNNNEDLAGYLMLAFNEASHVFGDMKKKNKLKNSRTYAGQCILIKRLSFAENSN